MRSLFRTAVCCLVPALAALANAETATLIGTYKGKEVGTGVYTIQTQPDGSVLKIFELRISVDGTTFESKASVLISASGQNLEHHESGVLNGRAKTDLSIIFGPNEAVINDKITGKSKSVPKPATGPASDPSDLWFMKLKPKVGDKSVGSVLTADNGWQPTTAEYEADKNFVLDGKMIKAHLVRHIDPSGAHERLVDDHGIPLQFEIPNVPGLEFTRK